MMDESGSLKTIDKLSRQVEALQRVRDELSTSAINSMRRLWRRR